MAKGVGIGFRHELAQMLRSRLLIVLTVLEAITFVVLVSLFGVTGARAPTALVDLDGGAQAQAFTEHLQAAHHSFSLRPMTAAQAQQQLADGRLVAIITIPAGFSQAIDAGETAAVSVDVDNLQTDMTADIERAVPSAVTTFGRDGGFTGVRVSTNEHDLVARDTGFVDYLAVSALALDALVVAGVLGAVSMTREFEAGTWVQWRLSPTSVTRLLVGKLLAVALVSAVAVLLAAAIVLGGYGIAPLAVPQLIAVLLTCVVIFTCLGACVGTLIRRTLPVASLFFGLALPVYIVSGALEPLRFDGHWLFAAGHLTPVYYSVALLQDSVHGLTVTPESTASNALVLAVWTAVAALVAVALVHRRVASS